MLTIEGYDLNHILSYLDERNSYLRIQYKLCVIYYFCNKRVVMNLLFYLYTYNVLKCIIYMYLSCMKIPPNLLKSVGSFLKVFFTGIFKHV